MSDKAKYSARVLDKIDNGRGVMNSVRVGVFDGDAQIGEYVRNYPSHAEGTFCPFEQGGRWFALYSRDYTATRVMSLPDCTDLGGEEPCGHGFCPVQYHVPELCGQDVKADDPQPLVANHDADRWAVKVPTEDGKHLRYFWPDDKDHPQPDEARKVAYLAEKERSHKASQEWADRHPFTYRHATWGFIYGCPWAAPYWLRFVDLSRAAEGVLVIDDRFGFLDMPRGVKSLADMIDTDRIDRFDQPPGETVIRIAAPVAYDLTGKRLED